jgi:pimeloyl-ACP methyl ester carboxylesterase
MMSVLMSLAVLRGIRLIVLNHVVRLLDHLGVHRTHRGYSLGGAFTAQLLTLHPGRFVTAALVAGAPPLEWTRNGRATPWSGVSGVQHTRFGVMIG